MSYLRKIGRLFAVDDKVMDEDFSLREETPKETSEETSEETRAAKETDDRGRVLEQERREGQPASEDPPTPERVAADLDENRREVENIFRIPMNADVIIRRFTVGGKQPLRAFVVFMEGLSDSKVINQYVLEPLMLLATLPEPPPEAERLQTIKEKLLPGNQVMEYERWTDVTKSILSGSTALFLEGQAEVLVVETKGWEHRSVGDTKTESVVRGPHDAFTEHLRANTGLVRARLRTEQLVTEMLQVGELAPTDIAVMYLDGVVNPRLVEEAKRRIEAVKVDFLQDSGQLEQYIEDPPLGLIPRMMATERPDRVAASLAEGYVAVFVGQSPYVLILPTMFWSLIHTAEDAYLRFPFGAFIRLIRFTALLLALLLPGLYIAVTNYHPEMIPTDLMLTIAEARERVPFPVVLEVLLMELSLELIREAGIRIPNVIGPTIGIVGALILGQAAVEAAVISPLLVIVVAVTALSAFTLPNYNISFAIRTLRFVFILLSACWGFYGITLGVMALAMHWSTMKSFGVPMLAPIAPAQPSSPDVLLRGPVYKQEMRPRPLRPQETRRQREVVRTWDPMVHDSQEAKRQRQQAQKHEQEEKK